MRLRLFSFVCYSLATLTLAGAAFALLVSPVRKQAQLKQRAEFFRDARERAESSERDLIDSNIRLAEVERAYADSLGQLSNVLWKFAALPLVVGLIVLGRKAGRATALEAFTAHPVQPILYLRSFKDDERPAAGSLEVRRLWTEEQRAVEDLSAAGPVLAIGKPRERLAPLGAWRMYVADDEWQNVVTTVAREARLVVVRAGFTDGPLWELRHLRERLSPERLLLYLPNCESGDLPHDLWHALNVALSTEFPRAMNGRRFVAFNGEWRAVPLNAAPGGPPDFSRRSSEREAVCLRSRWCEPERASPDLLLLLQHLERRIPAFRFVLAPGSVILLVIACGVVFFRPGSVGRWITGSLTLTDLDASPGWPDGLAEVWWWMMVAVFAARAAFQIRPQSRALPSVVAAAAALLGAVVALATQQSDAALR